MSSARINRVISQLENAVTELETGIAEAQEANTRIEAIIQGLKSKMNAIVEKITSWFNTHIVRNQQVIDENNIAIQRAEKLQANLAKLFED